MIPVCIFAKPPVPGEAKTRIGAVIGHEAAARLAGALLRDTWRAVAAIPWARPILATTDVGSTRFGLPHAERWDQGAGPLGDRITAILRLGIAEAGMAFALGADSPGLPVRAMADARARLRHHEAVLGRSADGGFWLLGLTRCPLDLLDDLPWSSPHTADATAARLAERLGGVAEVEPWFDVDRADDLPLLARRIGAGEVIAPETAEVLSALGYAAS